MSVKHKFHICEKNVLYYYDFGWFFVEIFHDFGRFFATRIRKTDIKSFPANFTSFYFLVCPLDGPDLTPSMKTKKKIFPSQIRVDKGD